MKRLINALIITIALALGTVAHAGHPLSTDDTGTQGMLKFLAEGTAEFSWDKDTSNGVTTKTDQQNLGLTFTAGLLDSLDASIAVPFTIQQVRVNDLNTLDNSGLNDITLGLKWRFLELGPLSFAIRPSMTIANGNQARSLGSGRTGYSANLISTVNLKPVALHANLGYTHQEYVDAVRPNNRTGIWKMSLAGGVEVLKGLQVVAELGASSNTLHTSDIWPAYVTGGVIYTIIDNIDLDLGVRGGFNKPSTDLMLLTGVAVRFP